MTLLSILAVQYNKPQQYPAADTVQHYYHTNFNKGLLVISEVMREIWNHIQGYDDINLFLILNIM